MKRTILLLLMMMVMAAAAFGQAALEATAEVDKTSVSLGDVVRYTFTVKREGDMSQAPSAGLPSFEGFRVAGSFQNSSMNFINGKASAINQQQIDLVAVKSGDITISPAKVKFLNPATKKYEIIETKAVTIHVGQGKRHVAAPQATDTPVPARTAEPDIRGIKMSMHMDFSSLMPYIILALIFLAAMYFAARKIFGKKAPAPDAGLEEDFRKEALRKARRAAELLKTGNVKGYYYDIYEAVRYFAGKNYKDSYDELTTQEILVKLKGKDVKEGDIRRISSFMKECDLVKFADYRPSEKEIESTGKEAEGIINEL